MTPHPRQSALARVLSRIVAAPIHVYRYAISPLLPPSCRYFPSCSEYALEAVQRHGPLTGAALAAARVCRCHPWSSGGVDPVPDSVQPLRALCARWPAALRGGNSAKAD